MTAAAIQNACTHVATPQEQERDPNYRTCNAQPGEPCTWAKRHDGLPDPVFHAERLEQAAGTAFQGQNMTDTAALQSSLDTETFREAILDTGLV
jgi:hypothetical protein